MMPRIPFLVAFRNMVGRVRAARGAWDWNRHSRFADRQFGPDCTAMMAGAQDSRSEWRAHWPLVLAAVIGLSVFPIYLYTDGLFVKPLRTEFGWTRAEANSSLLIVAVIAAMFSTWVGRLVDRFGSRRLAVAGILVFLPSFGLLSLNPGSLVIWRARWAILAIGVVLLSASVWTSVIANRFEASRGLALTVSYGGISLTSFLSPLVAGGLIDRSAGAADMPGSRSWSSPCFAMHPGPNRHRRKAAKSKSEPSAKT